MAVKPEIIPATVDHIAHIAANMRQGDRAELAAIGRSPESSLWASLKVSRVAWTGTIDGVPVCMFGVAPSAMITPRKGRPWMLGTAALDDHAILFLRRCRPAIKEMLAHYPELENYVAGSNEKAIEWLRWMGFAVGPGTVAVGLKKIPFLKFTLGGTNEEDN